jgi:signal peptidase I
MKSGILRWTKIALTLLLVGSWAVLFRPTTLGGPATFLVVRGTSMLPSYHTGDFVVLEAAPVYAVGDPVGYRVPAGQIGAGHLVLHRIIATDAGRFVVKGDNNKAADPWSPAPADVAGKVWIMIPGVGRVIDLLHQPIILGALAAAIVVAVMIGRAPPRVAPEPVAAAPAPESASAGG